MPKPKIVKGKVIPAWFLKELKIIDPTYFVDWNKHYGYYEIKKKMHKEVTDKTTGKTAVFNDPVVATYFNLVPDSLNNMRERKYIGRIHSGVKYLNWIISQNKIERRKKKLINRKLLAEALIDFHKFSGKHSVNIGGKNDRGRNKIINPQHFKRILDGYGGPTKS